MPEIMVTKIHGIMASFPLRGFGFTGYYYRDLPFQIYYGWTNVAAAHLNVVNGQLLLLSFCNLMMLRILNSIHSILNRYPGKWL